MRAWVQEFISEIDKINTFFVTKFAEYSQEYEILRDTFIKKKYGHRNGGGQNAKENKINIAGEI